MTSISFRWLSAERALATAILLLGLFLLLAMPTYASCDESVYVTGDMVGNGNPAEVLAALCV
jgi:hypothetical protein